MTCPKCGYDHIAEARIDGEFAYICMRLTCDYAWWADGEPCQMKEEKAGR